MGKRVCGLRSFNAQKHDTVINSAPADMRIVLLVAVGCIIAIIAIAVLVPWWIATRVVPQSKFGVQAGDILKLQQADGTSYETKCLGVEVGISPDGGYMETCRIEPIEVLLPPEPPT